MGTISLIGLVLSGFLFAPPPSPTPTYITHVTVIDVANGKKIRDRACGNFREQNCGDKRQQSIHATDWSESHRCHRQVSNSGPVGYARAQD